MQTTELHGLTQKVAEKLTSRNQKICCAESCTGGFISKTFTDLAGSSDWFDRGFVTYSNQAKMDMLGVKQSSLKAFGAVSEQVVVEMAAGALKHSLAEVSIAVTGIAGPGGGTSSKPVGTVWFGFALDEQVETQKKVFTGDRSSVREQSVRYALRRVCELLE
jgi:nicotinamide-nucleotide amidase